MFCRTCGKEVQDNAVFCPNCGCGTGKSGVAVNSAVEEVKPVKKKDLVYEIQGGQFPVVVCSLSAGEQMSCPPGSMLWMSSGFSMENSTSMNENESGFKKVVARAVGSKAAFRNLFINTYTAEKDGIIAFGSGVPGTILPIDVGQQNIIAPGYLAAETTVKISHDFANDIFLKYSGSGLVFVEVYGSIVTYDLEEGQTMILDKEAFALAEGTVTMDVEKTFKGIEKEKGVMSIDMKKITKSVGDLVTEKVGNIGGQSGRDDIIVKGPGKVWLQTMSLKNFANTIIPLLPGK